MNYFYTYRHEAKTYWRECGFASDEIALQFAPTITRSKEGMPAAWYRIVNERGRVIEET